jgi:L-alanine-DL-glutamate epimerase-like enolase superfamily enzyme
VGLGKFISKPFKSAKEGISQTVGTGAADWTSAFLSNVTTNAANLGTAGLYGVATGEDYKTALASAGKGAIDTGLGTGVPMIASGVDATKSALATAGSRAAAPPDVNLANDPNQAQQFQRLRKAAMKLGRAGTIKYKGSSTLGLGETLLGDQMQLMSS